MQLWRLGILMGHNPYNSRFLGTWCISGLVSKNKNKVMSSQSFYLLKYVYTLMGLRMFLGFFKGVVANRMAVIYVSHNVKFSGNVILYAMLAGEAYSAFNWVAGAITNWRKVIVSLYMIYSYYIQGMRLNHRHKKKMLILSGISFSRVQVAGMAFFFRLQEASVALQEGGSASLMSTGIVDTDVMASELNLPLVANDVSNYSLHFFAYYLTMHIIRLKIMLMLNWKSKIKKSSRKKIRLLLLNLMTLFDSNMYFHVDDTMKYLTNSLDYNMDFVLDNLNGYIIGGDFADIDQPNKFEYRIYRNDDRSTFTPRNWSDLTLDNKSKC